MVVSKFGKNKVPMRPKFGYADAEQQRAKNQSQYAKYMNQAREAAAQGDAAEAERFYQNAEHYARLMNRDHDAMRRNQATPTNGQNAANQAANGQILGGPANSQTPDSQDPNEALQSADGYDDDAAQTFSNGLGACRTSSNNTNASNTGASHIRSDTTQQSHTSLRQNPGVTSYEPRPTSSRYKGGISPVRQGTSVPTKNNTSRWKGAYRKDETPLGNSSGFQGTDRQEAWEAGAYPLQQDEWVGSRENRGNGEERESAEPSAASKPSAPRGTRKTSAASSVLPQGPDAITPSEERPEAAAAPKRRGRRPAAEKVADSAQRPESSSLESAE